MKKIGKLFFIATIFNLYFLNAVFSAPSNCPDSGDISTECNFSTNFTLSNNLTIKSGGKINVNNNVEITTTGYYLQLSAGIFNFSASSLTTFNGSQSILIDGMHDLSYLNNISFIGDFSDLNNKYYLIKFNTINYQPTSLNESVISNTEISTDVFKRKYLKLAIDNNTLTAKYIIDINIKSGGNYIIPTGYTNVTNINIYNAATITIEHNSGDLHIHSGGINLPDSPTDRFFINFDFNNQNNVFSSAKTIYINGGITFANTDFKISNFNISAYSTEQQFKLLAIPNDSFTGLTATNDEIILSNTLTNSISYKNYIKLSLANSDKLLIGTLKYDVLVSSGGNYEINNSKILTKLEVTSDGILTFKENNNLQVSNVVLQNNSIINFDFSDIANNDTIGKISGYSTQTNLSNVILKAINFDPNNYSFGNTFTLLEQNGGFSIASGQEVEVSTTNANYIKNKYYLSLSTTTNKLTGTYQHDLTINDDGNYVFNTIEGFSNIIVGDSETTAGENATLTIAKHTTLGQITKLTTNTLLFDTGSILNFDLTGIAKDDVLAEYVFNNNVSLAKAKITLSGTLGFFQIGDKVTFFKKKGSANLTNPTIKALIAITQPISNVVLNLGFNLSLVSDDLVGTFFREMIINQDGSVIFGNSATTNTGFSNSHDFHFSSITINYNGKLSINDNTATTSPTTIIIDNFLKIIGLTSSTTDNFNIGKNNIIQIDGSGISMESWANVKLGEGSTLNTTNFSMKTNSWFLLDKDSTLNISMSSISNSDIDNTAVLSFANGSKINFTNGGGVNNTNLSFASFQFAIGDVRNNGNTPIAEITGLKNNLNFPTNLVLITNENISDFWSRVAGDKTFLLKINTSFAGSLNPSVLQITNFYNTTYIQDINVERKKYFTFSSSNGELYATFGNDVKIGKKGNLVLGDEVFNKFAFDGCGASDTMCLLSLVSYVSSNDHFTNTSDTATLTIKKNSSLKILDSISAGTGLSAFTFDFSNVTTTTTFLTYQSDQNISGLFGNITITLGALGNITLPQTIITFSNISNDILEGTVFTLVNAQKLDGSPLTTTDNLSGIQTALDYYNNLKKKVATDETLASNVIASRRMFLELDGFLTTVISPNDTIVSDKLVGRLLIDVMINNNGELLFNRTTRYQTNYTTLKVNSGGTLTIGNGAEFGISETSAFNFDSNAKLKFDMSNYNGGGYNGSVWNAATFAKINYNDIDITGLNSTNISATGYSDSTFKTIFNSEFEKEFTLIEGSFLGSTNLKNTIRIYFDDCGSDCPTADSLITYKKGLQLIGDDSTFTALKAKFISDVWVASGGNLIFDNSLNYNSIFSLITIHAGGDLTIKNGAVFSFEKMVTETPTSDIFFDLTGATKNVKTNALLTMHNDIFQIHGDASDTTYNDDFTDGKNIIDIKHIKILLDTSITYNENDTFLLIDLLFNPSLSTRTFFSNTSNTYIKISEGDVSNDTVNGIYGCILSGSDNCISMSSGFNLFEENYGKSSTSYIGLFAKYSNSITIKDNGFYKIVNERKLGLLQVGDADTDTEGGKLIFTKDSTLFICEGGTAGGACANPLNTSEFGLIINQNSIFDFDFDGVTNGDTLGIIKQGYSSNFDIDIDAITFTANLSSDLGGIGGTTDYTVGNTFTLLKAEDYDPTGGANYQTTFSGTFPKTIYFSNGTHTTSPTTNPDDANVSYMKGLSVTNSGTEISGTYILDARINDDGNLTIGGVKQFSTLYVGDSNSGGQENATLTFKNSGELKVDGSSTDAGLIFESGSILAFIFDNYTTSTTPFATITDNSTNDINFYNVKDGIKLTKGTGVLKNGEEIILLQSNRSFLNVDEFTNPANFNSTNPIHFTDEDDDTTDAIDRFRYLSNLNIDSNKLVGEYFYDVRVKNTGEIFFGDSLANRETEQNIQELKIESGGTLTFGKNTTTIEVDTLSFVAGANLKFDLTGWNGSGALTSINNANNIVFSDAKFSAWLNGSVYLVDAQLTFLETSGADFTGTIPSDTIYFEDGINTTNNIEYKKGIGLEISTDNKKIIGTYKEGLTILDDGILEIPTIVATKYSFLKVGDNANHTGGKFATLSFAKSAVLSIGDIANGSFALNNGAKLNFDLYQSISSSVTSGNAIANDTIGTIQLTGTSSTISLAGVEITAKIGTDGATTTGTADYQVGDIFKLLVLTSTDKFDSLTTTQINIFSNTINYIKYNKGLDLSLVDSDQTIQGKYRYDVEVLKNGKLQISGLNNTFSRLLVGEGGSGGDATIKFVSGAIMEVKENITFKDDAKLIFDFAGYSSGNLIVYTGADLDFNQITTDAVSLTGYNDSFFIPGTTITLIDATSITNGFSNNVGKAYFNPFTSSLGTNIVENKGLKISVDGNKLKGVFIHDVTVQANGQLLIDTDREYTALKVETNGQINFKMWNPTTSISTTLKLETFEIENGGKIDFNFTDVSANMSVPLIALELNQNLDLTNTIITLSNANLLDTYNAGDKFVLLKLDDTNQKAISFNQTTKIFTGVSRPLDVILEIGLTIDREHTAGSGDSLVGKFVKNITINDNTQTAPTIGGIYEILNTERFSNLVVGDIDTTGEENATLSFKKDSDLTIDDSITLNTGSVFKFNFNGVDGTTINTIGKINVATTGLTLLDLSNTEIEVVLGSEIYSFGDKINLLVSDIEISGITSKQVYSPASWSEDDDGSGDADTNINVEYKRGFVVGRSPTDNKILEGEYIYSVVVHGKDKSNVAGDGFLRISNQVAFSTLNIGVAGETASATLVLANGAKINDTTNHLNTFIFAQNAKLKFDLTGFTSGTSSLAEIWTDGDVDLTNLVSADFEIELGGANLVVGQNITLMEIKTSTSFININDIQSITIDDNTTDNIRKFKFLDIAFNTGGTALSGKYTYDAYVKNSGNMLFGAGSTESDTEADYTFSNMVVENGGKLTLSDMSNNSGNFPTTTTPRVLKTNLFDLQAGGTLILKEGSKLNVETTVFNGIIEFDFAGVVANDIIATIDASANGISLMNATIKLTNFDPGSLDMVNSINLIKLTGGNQITFVDITTYFESYANNSDVAGVKNVYGLKLTKTTNDTILSGIGVNDLYIREDGFKDFTGVEKYSTIHVGYKANGDPTSIIESGKMIFKIGSQLTFDELKFKAGSTITFDFNGVTTGNTIAKIYSGTSSVNLTGANFEVTNLSGYVAGNSFVLLDSDKDITGWGSSRFITNDQFNVPNVAVDTSKVLEISLDVTLKKIMGTYTQAVVIHKTGVLTLGSTDNPNYSTTNLKVGDNVAATNSGSGDTRYGTLLFKNGGVLTVENLEFTSGLSKLAFDLTNYTTSTSLAKIINTNSISLGSLSEIEITQGTGNNFDINDTIKLLTTNGITGYGTLSTKKSFADAGNNTLGADNILRNKYLYDIKIDNTDLIGKYGYDVEVKSGGDLKFGSAGSEVDSKFSSIKVENSGTLTLSNTNATTTTLNIDKDITFATGSNLKFQFQPSYNNSNPLSDITDNLNIDISNPTILLSGYTNSGWTKDNNITLIKMTSSGKITGTLAKDRIYFNDYIGLSSPTIEDFEGLLLSIDGSGNLVGKFIHDINVLLGGILEVGSADPYNNVNIKTGGTITFKNAGTLQTDSMIFDPNSNLNFNLIGYNGTGTLATITTTSTINLANIGNNVTIEGMGGSFSAGAALTLLEVSGGGNIGAYSGGTTIYFADYGGANGLETNFILKTKSLRNVTSTGSKLVGNYKYDIVVKNGGNILFSNNTSDAGRETELQISSIKVENGGKLTLKEGIEINTSTNKLQTLTFDNGSKLVFDFTNIGASNSNAIGKINTDTNLILHNDTIALANSSGGYNVDDTFKLLEITSGNSISGYATKIDFAPQLVSTSGYTGQYTIESALDLSLNGSNVLQGKYSKSLIVDNNSGYEIAANDKYNYITIADGATSKGDLIIKNNTKLEATKEIIFNEGSVLKFDFTGLFTLSSTELLKLNANNSNGEIDLSKVSFELVNSTISNFTPNSGVQKFLQLETGSASKILLKSGKNLIYFNENQLSSFVDVMESDMFELSVANNSGYDYLQGQYKKGVRVKTAGNFVVNQTYPSSNLYDIVSVEGTLTFANNGELKTKSIVFVDGFKLTFDLSSLSDSDLDLAKISDITENVKILGSNTTITKGTGTFSTGKTINLLELSTGGTLSYTGGDIIFDNTGDINNVVKKRYLSNVKVDSNVLNGIYKYDITINSGNDELQFAGTSTEESNITTLTAKSGGTLTLASGANITIQKMTFEAGSILEFDFDSYSSGDIATIDNANLISLNNATIKLSGWNGGSFFTKGNTLSLIKKGGSGQGITGYNAAKRWYFDESEDVIDNTIYNVFTYNGLEVINVNNELQGTYIYDLFVKNNGQYSLNSTSYAYSNTYIENGGTLLLKQNAVLKTDNLIFDVGSKLHFDLSDYSVGNSLATINNTAEIKLNNLTDGAIIIDQGNANLVVGDTIQLLASTFTISGYQPANSKIMFNDSTTSSAKGFLKDISINFNVLTGEYGVGLVVEKTENMKGTSSKTFNYVVIKKDGSMKFDANSDSTITISDNDNFVNDGIIEFKDNVSLKLDGGGGKLVNNGIIIIGSKDDFRTVNLDVKDISLTGGELHFLISKNYDTTALDPLLSITTAGSDIGLTNSKIKLFSQVGSINLDVGKKIKLMETNKIFVGTPQFDKEEGVIEIHEGWTKVYYADLLNEGKQLTVTISEKTLAEETKALNEATISSSVALINTLSFVENAVVRDVIYNSNSASNSGIPNQNLGALFVSNAGYSKTITGSYVEGLTGNVVVGFDAYNALIRNLNVAAFVEASSTNFTTHNDFSTGIMELKGTNMSIGAGGLGIYRYEFASGNALSFEASVHSGFVITELVDDLHDEFSYKMTSAYFAGHTGLTYSYYTGADTYIDFFGKLLLTNNQGGETKIKTTDTLKAKPFTAKRVKTGINFNGTFNAETNYYIGAGAMYDLESRQESTLDNLAVESTSIAGASIMFSGGINGSFNYNWKYNAGLDLTSGKTTSANITLGVKYLFDEETENAYKYNRRPSFSGDGYGSGGSAGGYEGYGTMNKVDAKKLKAEEYKKQFEEELKRKDTSAGIVKGASNKNKGKKKRKDDDDSIIRVERVVELEEETRTERQNAY